MRRRWKHVPIAWLLGHIHALQDLNEIIPLMRLIVVISLQYAQLGLPMNRCSLWLRRMNVFLGFRLWLTESKHDLLLLNDLLHNRLYSNTMLVNWLRRNFLLGSLDVILLLFHWFNQSLMLSWFLLISLRSRILNGIILVIKRWDYYLRHHLSSGWWLFLLRQIHFHTIFRLFNWWS